MWRGCGIVFGLALVCAAGGCSAFSTLACPGDRLWFPKSPVRATAQGRFYDVHGRGRADFAILHDDTSKLDVLEYDDDGDGNFDRSYRLSDYGAEDVPHLILLMDSLPYRLMKARYEAGDWRWFNPPQKVIPPFPTMTTIILNAMLGGPPMPGFSERYYERGRGVIVSQWMPQVLGYAHPWHRRIDWLLPYWQVGLMYLNPRPWYAYELARIKRSFDEAPNRVYVGYVQGSSGLVCRYGEAGAEAAMDQIEQLCMQVIYERRGAVKITLVSDHGHTLMPSRNVMSGIAEALRRAGFHLCERMKAPTDVVVEHPGMGTYVGLHTQRPAAVAEAMLKDGSDVAMAIYQKGDRIIVRDAAGSASIERNADGFRYEAIDSDVLKYQEVLRAMRKAGQMNERGFASSERWLEATADLEYPDGPRRLWDAFHGEVVNTPDVALLLKDGRCAGLSILDRMVTIGSSHGGLNQINSDAMVMTMARSLKGPLRTAEVMKAVEPGYSPTVAPGEPGR